MRASYGTLGNQNVGPYDYIAKMKAKSGSYIVNDSYLNYLNTPGAISANFTWETSETFNLGFDLSFLMEGFPLHLTGINVTLGIC